MRTIFGREYLTHGIGAISDMRAEESTIKWHCMICGYIHVGAEPLHVCPVCNAPQKIFEPISEEDLRDTIA
jgi:rubrerythrin